MDTRTMGRRIASLLVALAVLFCLSTVALAEDPVATLSIDKTSAITMEDFVISGSVSGDTEWHLQSSDGFAETFEDNNFEYTAHRWSRGNYEFWVEDEEGNRLGDSVSVEVDAPNGILEPAEVSMSDTFNVGQDITAEVFPVENACDYTLAIINAENGEWVWSTDFTELGPVTVAVNEDFSLDPGAYSFDVFAHGNGYDQSHAGRGFVVLGDPEAGLTVSVDIEDVNHEVPVNTGFNVHVEAPEGATGIRVYMNGSWTDFGGNVCDWWVTVDRDRAYPITARYTMDGIGEDTDWNALTWSGFAEPVTVTGTSTQELEQPEWDAATEVARGNQLEIMLLGDHPIEDGRIYHAWIDRWNGIEYEGIEGWFYSWQSDSIMVDTLTLGPGDYRLWVGNDGEGYLGCGNWHQLVVNDPEGDDTYITVDRTDVETYEEIYISAYIPGANQIRLVPDSDLWNDAFLIGDTDCLVNFPFRFEDGGRHMIQVTGYYEDGSVRYTDPVYVNVSLPHGNLPRPVVNFELDEDGNFIFTIEPVEGASSITADVFDTVTEERLFEEEPWFDGNGGSFTVSGNQLLPDHIYIAWIHANPEGTGSSYSFAPVNFMAPGSFANPAEGFEVTVNGSTEDQTFDFQQEFGLRIYKEGATLLQYWDGEFWHTERPDEHGVWASRGCASVKDYLLIARYTTEEIGDEYDPEAINWEGYSAPIAIYINAYADKTPMLSFSAPESVHQGEDVEIHLDLDEDHTYVGFQAWLRDIETGDDVAHTGSVEGGDPSTIFLQTVGVAPGRYLLDIYGNAVGCTDMESYTIITIEEPENDGIQFSVTPTYMQLNDWVSLKAYAPGAEQIQIYRDGEEWRDPYDGEYMEDGFGADGSGDFYAVARYAEGDDQESEHIWVEMEEQAGRLNHPVVYMLMNLRPDEDLVFSFSGVDNAADYSAEVTSSYYDGYTVFDSSVDIGSGLQPETEYSVPASRFETGFTYTLHVWASARGWENAETAVDFCVIDADVEEGAVVTVNGSTEQQVIPVLTPFTVDIELPEDATFWMMKRPDGCDEWGDQFDTHRDFDYDQETTFYYTLKYTKDEIDQENIDWENINWCGVSNAVQVVFTTEGDYTPPVFTLETPTVARGELVRVSVEPEGDEDEMFWGEFSWWNEDTQAEDWASWTDWDGEGTLYLSTANLGAGEYTLHVSHGCPGWNRVEADDQPTVTITEPEQSVTLSIAPANVQAWQPFRVSAYAPGADQVVLFLNYSSWEWEDGEILEAGRSFDENGPHEIFALARYSDGHTERSESIFVNVSAEGTLAIPRVDVEGGSAIFDAEQNVMFSVEPVEHGEYYNASVRKLNSEDEPLFDQDIQPGEPYTIDASSLEAGCTYEIWAKVSGRNWSSNETAFQFYVRTGEEDGPYLTINGLTDDQEITAHTPFIVRLEHEGATAFRFWDGENWHDRTADEDGVWEEEWQQRGGFAPVLYGIYTSEEINDDTNWDELAWSGIGNAISILNTTEGRMDPPEFTEPEPVKRGELLVIPVANTGEEGLFIAANLLRWNDETQEMDHAYWECWDGNGAIIIQTSELEPGVYQLEVFAHANGLDSSAPSYGWVTIEEPEEGKQFILSASKTDVLVDEEFTLSVYAPGMANVVICLDEMEEYFDGENGSVRWSRGDPGDFSFFAYGYDAEGNYCRSEDTITVSVTSLGTLDRVEVTAPTRLQANEDLEFSFNSVDNAEWYEVIVENETQHFELFHEARDAGDTITIPAENFSGGELYAITVIPHAYGYQSKSTIARFAVVEQTAQEINVEVSNENPGVNESVLITIDAPGATAIRWSDGFSWNDWWEAEHSEIWWASDEPGTRVILAKVSYDENFDWENDDWDEHEWSEVSEPLVINVSSVGQLERPVVTVPETVALGDTLNITIEPVEHAEWYDVRIRDLNDDEHYIQSHPAGDLQLLTVGLEEGWTYYVDVWAAANGWEGKRNNTFATRFTVTAPANGLTLKTERSEVMLGEEFRVSAVAPDAEQITLLWKLKTDSDWQEIGTYDGGKVLENVRLGSAGACYVRAVASYADGTTKARNIEITVISNGQLDAPGFDIPASIWAGEWLYGEIYPVEHADQYHISIDYFTASESENMIYQEGLSAGGFEVDTTGYAPGSYFLTCNAFADYGYESNSSGRGFRVVDPNTSNVFELPADLHEIEEEAFCGLPMEVVIIPDSVERIGDRAFADCGNLGFVVIPNGVTSFGNNLFEGSQYVVIICNDDSPAADWAEDHGIAHRPE